LQCGSSTWTGNSSDPPASVPAYVSTVALQSVSQTGARISGTSADLVVVQTRPGYAPNPGNAGIGTVVAIIATCP
jgi:hypothetical protein